MVEIKFISYDGEYPNLCRGMLKLEINGKEYIFGKEYDWVGNKWERLPDRYPAFWTSGGFITANYTAVHDEWQLDESELPDELKQYGKQIIEVFNENVDHGCCGGCI